MSTSKGGRAKPTHTRAATAVARAFVLVALLAVLPSAQSNDSRDDGKMLRQVATIPTITVTTPADKPYAFVGMPASIKAGTYKIKYINNSGIAHNFKIKGNSQKGFQATPECSKCTKTITVTFTRFIDGKLSSSRQFVCDPHASFMKGTVKITAT
jgi:plastocyanin